MSVPRISGVTRCAVTGSLLSMLVAAASPALADQRASPAPRPDATAAAEAYDQSFRWSVAPANPEGETSRSFFVYDVRPGQSIEDWVAVTNYGDEPMTFKVYGTDAFNTEDGSFALLEAGEEPRLAGTWLEFDPADSVVDVEPGETRVIPLTMVIPDNAEPGDHAAGVVISVAHDAIDAQGQLVRVDRRIAARVYLRVEGPARPALQVEAVHVDYDYPWWNPFRTGTATVAYRMRNAGNLRLAADSQIAVKGPFNVPLGEPAKADVPEMLPGTVYEYTHEVTGVYPLFWLSAKITAEPQPAPQAAGLTGVGPVTRSASAAAVPWPIVAGLLLLTTVLLWRRKRAKTKLRVAVAAAVAQARAEAADPAAEPGRRGEPEDGPEAAEDSGR